SKLTTSQILIPLELEFNLSRKSEDELKKGFKLGIGGYAGLNYFTKEVIKFDESAELRKQENYGSFNVNPFVYGLSGYLGYNRYALFVKYDLSTFFRESDTRAISAGLRFNL
ncbi:MAG: outer membrane beta-barrel protein, partial [Flavobacteriaceae bacterium]|nr:outer membrane beta-barrel protein [Flavobacteriaceae bacterium]